jgi:RNA polymerase sigma-70 factor (ECF subfamily)
MAGSMESDESRKELAQLHKSAFGWAMVCCGRNRDLAAEVLHQAYCRILAGDASFAGNSKFSTWVFGVIRHVAHEEIRRRQRQRRLFQPNTPIAAQACAVVDSEHATIEQCELAEQLCSALEELSDRQREVLHLTFYENMTIEQAANILDITVGSARQHYQRGKAALRRILATRRELEQ